MDTSTALLIVIAGCLLYLFIDQNKKKIENKPPTTPKPETTPPPQTADSPINAVDEVGVDLLDSVASATPGILLQMSRIKQNGESYYYVYHWDLETDSMSDDFPCVRWEKEHYARINYKALADAYDLLLERGILAKIILHVDD